jgi:hypothetical protein
MAIKTVCGIGKVNAHFTEYIINAIVDPLKNNPAPDLKARLDDPVGLSENAKAWREALMAVAGVGWQPSARKFGRWLSANQDSGAKRTNTLLRMSGGSMKQACRIMVETCRITFFVIRRKFHNEINWLLGKAGLAGLFRPPRTHFHFAFTPQCGCVAVHPQYNPANPAKLKLANEINLLRRRITFVPILLNPAISEIRRDQTG